MNAEKFQEATSSILMSAGVYGQIAAKYIGIAIDTISTATGQSKVFFNALSEDQINRILIASFVLLASWWARFLTKEFFLLILVWGFIVVFMGTYVSLLVQAMSETTANLKMDNKSHEKQSVVNRFVASMERCLLISMGIGCFLSWIIIGSYE